MNTVRDFLKLPSGGPTGQDVRIAVLDSGIDHKHPDLRNAVDVDAGVDCRYNTRDAVDRYYHGTHIAGIIAGSGERSGGRYRGIAPSARLIPLKVCESHRDEIEGFHIKQGVAAAIREKADILVLAITLSPVDPVAHNSSIAPPWVHAQESHLQWDLERADDEDVLCVVAAGNDGQWGDGTINPPAGSERVIAVGSCLLDGTMSGMSSRGPYWIDPKLDPGGQRAWLGSTDAVIPRLKPDLTVASAEVCAPLATCCHRGAYWLDGGTSQGAAIVAGLAACALEMLRTHSIIDLRGAQSAILRRLLCDAAKLESDPRTHAFGNGRLRWPALQKVIERFTNEDEYFRDVTRGSLP